MNQRLSDIWKFITYDIWRITESEVTRTKFSIYNIIKTIYLCVNRFNKDRIVNKASALTYSTLLAIVPILAIVFAIGVYVLMSKTTFGYQLKACGSNRHAARYAGIADKRNIVISMAIAGGLSAAGASLYYLSGNTEFFWSTYQSLPAIGFNGIPVAMLASCNPIGIIFTALFMSMLDISGLQLTNLTAYNEYITNVIIAVIVYLSAFSLVIRMMLSGRKKKKIAVADTAPIPQCAAVEDQTSLLPEEEKAPVEAAVTDSDNAEGGDQA